MGLLRLIKAFRNNFTPEPIEIDEEKRAGILVELRNQVKRKERSLEDVTSARLSPDCYPMIDIWFSDGTKESIQFNHKYSQAEYYQVLNTLPHIQDHTHGHAAHECEHAHP